MKSLLSSVCVISIIVVGCGQKEEESSNKSFYMPPSNPPAEVVTIPAEEWQQSQEPPQAETTFGLSARTLIASNTQTKASSAPRMKKSKYDRICDNIDGVTRANLFYALFGKSGVTCKEAWEYANNGAYFDLVWIQNRVYSLELLTAFNIGILSVNSSGADRAMLQPIINEANRTNWLEAIELPDIYDSCPITRDICE